MLSSDPTPDPPSASAPTPCVAVLGTCDTKLDELLYVRDRLLRTHGTRATLIDVGRTPSTHPAVTISQPSLLASSTSSPPLDISTLDRAALLSALADRAAPVLASLIAQGEVHGLVALGGSGGSALAGAVMRRLPLGFPKLLVSTMAAGDVSAFVGESDVAMLYSVVDIAGLNDILCPILDNAAGAIAGMAWAYRTRHTAAPAEDEKGEVAGQGKGGCRRQKRIAITMFGLTTPAVTHARALLARYACTPYRLIAEGFFDGVLDLTTTELADELVGGVLSAGPARLEAAARASIPQVVSLGALDMVNFGPRASVPERFAAKEAGRRLHEHNASVTLMRTTRDECAALGRIIAEKLKEAGARADRTEVWIPRGGVSLLDVSGGPFWDPEADEALAYALKGGLQADEGAEKIRVVERDEDINSSAFVDGMVQALVRLMQLELADRGQR